MMKCDLEEGKSRKCNKEEEEERGEADQEERSN